MSESFCYVCPYFRIAWDSNFDKNTQASRSEPGFMTRSQLRASDCPGHATRRFLIGRLVYHGDPCWLLWCVPIYTHGQSRDLVRQMSKTGRDLGHGSAAPAAPRLFLFDIETINYHSQSVRNFVGRGNIKFWASDNTKKPGNITLSLLITGHTNQFRWSRIYFF